MSRPADSMMPAKQQSQRSFTEAVPLSLSSMAHMSLPLEEGVSDAMRQVLQHTLMACVQYARAMYAPHSWTFRDLITSAHAWKAVYGGSQPTDLPQSLTKLGLKHQYIRHCLIYLSSGDGTALQIDHETELAALKDWNSTQNAILGRIALLYASPEMLTAEEMEALADNDMDSDDDTPPTILYKVVVEYRSLPPTGKVQAVEAEELSMLSFGGSVDDDVKYGALAALYDRAAKYVLDIYSVRGKKYKFDLMDSTLGNGTVPKWKSDDPFAKSLCVTVTDHGPPSVGEKNAITRMHLTLEGLLRSNDNLDSLPPFTKYPKEMIDTFCILDPNRSALQTATGMPSKQTLLLDARLAGKVHVNGRLITTWGADPAVGTHVQALFGMDMVGIPLWHGRIVDYEVFKSEYARLWQDVLIDARLSHLNIADKLLYRLIHGHDDGDEYFNDDEESADISPDSDCLESQVMSSPKYDPVGICAKALATHFAAEYGKNAYPCLAHEVEWVQTRLGGKSPVVVPQRLLSILRRGGYFDVRKTIEYEWETEFRLPKEGDAEFNLVADAIKLLEASGCTDVAPTHVCFVNKDKLPSSNDCLANKSVCRYNDATRQYFVNDAILSTELSPEDGGESMETDNDATDKLTKKARALLLGMYVAQEHPDGTVLARYFLRHCPEPLGGS